MLVLVFCFLWSIVQCTPKDELCGCSSVLVHAYDHSILTGTLFLSLAAGEPSHCEDFWESTESPIFGSPGPVINSLLP
jgi:hypothetical protein